MTCKAIYKGFQFAVGESTTSNITMRDEEILRHINEHNYTIQELFKNMNIVT